MVTLAEQRALVDESVRLWFRLWCKFTSPRNTEQERAHYAHVERKAFDRRQRRIQAYASMVGSRSLSLAIHSNAIKLFDEDTGEQVE